MTKPSIANFPSKLCHALSGGVLGLFVSVAQAEYLSCDLWLDGRFWWRATAEDVVRCLSEGVDVNIRSHYGVTALHQAVDPGVTDPDPVTVDALLAAGANPNAQTETGIAPIHRAKHSAIIDVLAKAGADLNVRTDGPWIDDTGLIRRLGLTPLNLCVFSRPDPDCAAALAAAGADPNLLHPNGDVPLEGAMSLGDLALVKALIASGAEPCTNIVRTESGDFSYYYSPLHRAVGLPQAMFSALVQSCADLDVRDFFGKTPLYEAAEQGYLWYVYTLIDAGADLNAPDDLGITPLHNVARRGFGPRNEIIEVLLDAGADGSIRDPSGRTPFDLIPEDSDLIGTKAHWRLNKARFD